jgi:hypothetical protein
VILISHLFRLSRVRHRFYFHLSGLVLNFRDVRNLVVPKIDASGEYLKFITRANTNLEPRSTLEIFIPGKLIGTRRLRFSAQIIRFPLVNHEIAYEDPKLSFDSLMNYPSCGTRCLDVQTVDKFIIFQIESNRVTGTVNPVYIAK